MAYVLVRHKVNDYEVWKSVFDDFADSRKLGGEKAYQVFRAEDDSNNVILLFEWESFESAHAFLHSQDLKDAMQKAGVAEEPYIRFMEEADRGTL